MYVFTYNYTEEERVILNITYMNEIEKKKKSIQTS